MTKICTSCGLEYEAWGCDSPYCKKCWYERMQEGRRVLVKKVCKDCGAKYEGTPGTRLCPDCRQKRAIAGRERRRQEMKDTLSYRKGIGKPRVRKIVRTDVSQCRKCLYKLYLTDGNGLGAAACGYLYFTGHKRPCEPSPECTVFKLYQKAARDSLIKEARENY